MIERFDIAGYTFEQRKNYQTMRRELVRHKKDILIVNEMPVTDTNRAAKTAEEKPETVAAGPRQRPPLRNSNHPGERKTR